MAYRASSATTAISSGSPFVINAPVGLAAGDLIVIAIEAATSTTGTYTWPTGFTQLGAGSNIGGFGHGANFAIATKLATSSEPSTYSIAYTNTLNQAIGIAAAWTGRSGVKFTTVTPGGSNFGASNITLNLAGGVAAAGDDVAWFGMAAANGAYSYTAPALYTSQASYIASGTGLFDSVNLSIRDNVPAGATGTISGTLTGTTGADAFGIVISLTALPIIDVQPTNQSALIGQTATFSVTASGATSYQWRSGSVALKGTPTTGSNSSSSSNPVLNVPTGATSGDEYVVSIEYYNSPGTITAPAGFTQIATASSGVANIYTYRRAYTGTEGATFTWTPTTQRPWAGICAIVTNGVYVTANASAQTNGFLSGGSNSAGATGSVTPTSTNQFVLAFCDTQTDVGAITASITDPTGFTRSVFNDSGQGLAMSLAYKTETSSSAVSYSYGSSWSAGVNCWTAGAAVVYQSGNPISGATNFSRVTPAILNSAYGNGAGATSITTTAINTTTGSTFVICNPSSLQNTPTDSKGNVYTLIGQSALTANSFRVNVYACFSGIGGVGHTATATYTSSGNRYVSFHELSSGTTVDITAIGVQAASPYSATTAALSYTNELAMLFGVQDYSTGGAYTLAETTGFSTLLNVADAGGSYDGYLFGYKSLSSTSAITPTWTSTVSPTRSGASVVIVFGGLSSSSYTTGTLASSNNGTLYAVDCTNSAGTTTSNTVRLLVSSNGVGRLGMFDPEMRILSWF